MARRSQGGPYPPDWKAIARRVKDAAGWCCIRCNHPHDPATGYTLTVHHLDMNPANCAWWNLAALCQRCHLSIQSKVVMERPWMLDHSPWMRPLVAGYYAAQYGLPDDPANVLPLMDVLIAMGQGRPLVRAVDLAN